MDPQADCAIAQKVNNIWACEITSVKKMHKWARLVSLCDENYPCEETLFSEVPEFLGGQYLHFLWV